MLDIFPAETPEHIALAREFITEYARALDFNLCFQNLHKEIAGLPGKYTPPEGRLFLAFWAGRPAGMIALRPMEDRAKCEMKRLYVRSEFRGHAIGRVLAEKVIAAARESKYTHMCLDTIQGKMDPAIRLYRELGFRETHVQDHDPIGRFLYMELALDD